MHRVIHPADALIATMTMRVATSVSCFDKLPPDLFGARFNPGYALSGSTIETGLELSDFSIVRGCPRPTKFRSLRQCDEFAVEAAPDMRRSLRLSRAGM
jgi:hypothetical protein